MTSLTAVRSCWAAAFAVDPLARLDACGLPLDALELGILIQPELTRTRGRHGPSEARRRHRPAWRRLARPGST